MFVDYLLSIEELPQECIDDCSASGAVDDALDFWVKKLDFTVNQENARKCLKGYGAWDSDELQDVNANCCRVLWLACGTFHDYQIGGEDAGSDIYVLE
jgi:hypothetical protein